MKSAIIKKKKNDDIQLLRAAAITAVLGFHLRPSWVPQGYLGVDIFFVISGYLMTVILDNKTLTLSNVLTFYERRLKRLLPAYLLTVFLTLLVSGFFLISTDYDFLKIDTLWSMFFGTNFQSMFQKQSYFLLVSDYKFLLHTWSLSLEIQYYFIVPFILIPISHCENRLMITSTIATLSFAFQTFIPYPTVSFGLVISRIWQFLAGTLAFYFVEKKTSYTLLLEETEEARTSDSKNTIEFVYFYRRHFSKPNGVLKVFLFSGLLGICFMPKLSDHCFYVPSIRLLAILGSFMIIYFGHDSMVSLDDSHILYKLGVYLGDVSYSIYLLHWPIIIFLKYQAWFGPTPLRHIIGFIIFISIIQYHCYEKLLLHQSTKVVFSICISLYLGLLVLMVQPQAFGYTAQKFADPAVAGNQQIAKACESPLVDCNWDKALLKVAKHKPKTERTYLCSYKGSGNLTIYFTGNSFARQQLPAIKKALSKYYKKLYFVSKPVCLVFNELNNRGWPGQCDAIMGKTEKFLRKIQPDIMLITERVSKFTYFQSPVAYIEEAHNDTTTEIMAADFQMFSKYAKKIFHIEPHPAIPTGNNPALAQAKAVAQGRDLSYKYISAERVTKEVDPGWLRIKAAMMSCPKCAPIEIRPDYLGDDGKFYIYDRDTKLSLFCDDTHFSDIGALKMVPTLQRVISEAVNNLEIK